MLIAREVVLVERRWENPVTPQWRISEWGLLATYRGAAFTLVRLSHKGYYLNSRSNKKEVPNNGFHLEGGK